MKKNNYWFYIYPDGNFAISSSDKAPEWGEYIGPYTNLNYLKKDLLREIYKRRDVSLNKFRKIIENIKNHRAEARK